MMMNINITMLRTVRGSLIFLSTARAFTSQQQRQQLKSMENYQSSYLLGAIIGDIVGSRFEHSRGRVKTTEFDLVTTKCKFTDDTVLTIAVADALINRKPYADTIRKWANKYPGAGYGKTFRQWMRDDAMGPYQSWGNGSAMRVSPCGYLPTLEKVLEEAKVSAECTHDHEEGIKGAQATAACIFLARNGKSKEEIKQYVTDNFGYDLNRSIEEIRPTYKFEVSCQKSVPEAIIAFLDSESYEDTIRLAVSLGGDTDTQAAIAGSIAQAFYKKIPPELESQAKRKLNEEITDIVNAFNSQIECFE
mmetsp:Transcript_2936/g.4261  ORF Transcript_2936/g.4261 Transcript_2936/m.4261 type:complete len:305 (-) Transcript_2936:96-1010(-)